jgi:EAL domain-containing protein (putative c-di-GMP-specific phosphodiesterase class I)
VICCRLRLARELELFVVAGGIETAEQLGYLQTAGASHGQGFHLAGPMPAAALTRKLQA